MSRALAAPAAALVLVLAVLAVPASAYLKLGSRIGDRNVSIRWTALPVRYYVTDRAVTNVSAQQFQTAITRAFASWDAVPSADTSSEFAGFTRATPVSGDGMNVLGFAARPDLDRVLAATTFLVDTTTAEILESDIFFNSAFGWSVSAGGEGGRHDLEAIAVHEVGHLLGLGHSAIGETDVVPGGRRVTASEAVMFPIAFSAGSIASRTLRPDDVAGITDIYPAASVRRRLGSISGRITKNGAGVFGAHIVAFSTRTGALIGGFSLSQDGSFTIGALEPGPYVIRVEPLDDAELDGFFDRSSTSVDLNFRPRFHDRVVVVPQGGGANGVDIAVSPR